MRLDVARQGVDLHQHPVEPGLHVQRLGLGEKDARGDHLGRLPDVQQRGHRGVAQGGGDLALQVWRERRVRGGALGACALDALSATPSLQRR